MASQWRRLEGEMGARWERVGEGSVVVVLSSWRRRLVDGGVGEREVVAIVGFGSGVEVDVRESWVGRMGVDEWCVR